MASWTQSLLRLEKTWQQAPRRLDDVSRRIVLPQKKASEEFYGVLVRTIVGALAFVCFQLLLTYFLEGSHSES